METLAVFPFWIIPILLGAATGTLVEKNFCDKDQEQRVAYARSVGKPVAPTGDKLCALLERDRQQFRDR
jgi:hypothetical protein